MHFKTLKTSGFTLPLFEFQDDEHPNAQATCIRWNPSVPDLFAVAYAPGEKSTSTHGYVCSWTLKNQSTPRNTLDLPAPALSLDWCKSQPSILAAGCSDGNIAIYDVRSHKVTPMYSTASLPGRHSGGVSVVRWQPEDASGNLQLLSAGLDGKILLWTMVQSEMKVTEISSISAGVIALDYFNEQSTHYTIAADDGKIYKVLRTRTTQEPESFVTHSPPLIALSYNKFHTAVFASTGADWSVKIWREGQTNEPLQIYDYAPYYPTDITFAPHSSTVFAVVTSNGELFIYDIDINRYEPICQTPVVETQDGSLTSVSFHPKWPVILVGDEKGRVHALKLSPNMRVNTRTKKDEEERNKLRKTTSSAGGASRGLLPDLSQQPDDDDDGGANAAQEEENAKQEMLKHDETVKFETCLGVSWIKKEEPHEPPAKS